MNYTESSLRPVFASLSQAATVAERTFFQIPGSAVVARYVKSSHQNDPGRTILELILAIFVIRTIFQSRSRRTEKGRVVLTEKVNYYSFRFYNISRANSRSSQEIDELVDDWVPEPLTQPLSAADEAELASVPVIVGASGPRPKLQSNGKTVLNLSSFNFAGLANNEDIKNRAIDTLSKYGLGSCGPPGFYGMVGKLFYVFILCNETF